MWLAGSTTTTVRPTANANAGQPGQSTSSTVKPWIVKTQSKAPPWLLARPQSGDGCSFCAGTGRTKCEACSGRGRVNRQDQPILPLDEWPAWCGICRGGGLWGCPRCMGTGVKRKRIGFRLAHESDDMDD